MVDNNILKLKTKKCIEESVQLYSKIDSKIDSKKLEEIILKLVSKMETWHSVEYSFDKVVNEIPLITSGYHKFQNEDLTSVREEFLSCLSDYEKYLLKDKIFSEKINLLFKERGFFFNCILTISNGYVVHTDYLNKLVGIGDDNYGPFTGKHLKQIKEEINKSGLVLIENNELDDEFIKDELHKQARNKLFEAVTYKILDNNRSKFGTRKAFIFAKHVGSTLDIPMIYGLESSDEGIEYLLDAYLTNGGNPKLTCIKNFYKNDSNPAEATTIENMANGKFRSFPSGYSLKKKKEKLVQNGSNGNRKKDYQKI